MAEKWKDDPQDEPMTGVSDERIRGVGEDDGGEFEGAEELDDEDEEEDEEGSTF